MKKNKCHPKITCNICEVFEYSNLLPPLKLLFKTVRVFKLTLSDLFRATDLANCANLLKPNKYAFNN
jgi:hypothetical protein